MGSAKHFHSPCKKRLRQRCFHNLIKKLFIVVHLALPNSFVFRDSRLEVVGNVRLVRIQPIRVVNWLTVDVHFNIRKNWVQNVLYKSNERNWSLLLPVRRRFLICFWLFFVLFFVIVTFVTTTLDNIQFQSQVRLSQINLVVPIYLKFKRYSIFNEWGGGLNFLVVAPQ